MHAFGRSLLLFLLVFAFSLPAAAQPTGLGAPGTHTIVLRPNHAFVNKTTRSYKDVPFFGAFIHRNLDCSRGGQSRSYLQGNGAALVVEAGWGEVRGDGHPGSAHDPCLAWVTEAAVDFDMGPYNAAPGFKVLRRATLSYREREAAACMTLVYTQGGFLADPLACYTRDDGTREPKPSGCLTVAVPPEDWVAHAPNRRLETLPNMNFPRLDSNSWDVTGLVQNRINPPLMLPNGPPVNRGHGFMLVGTPVIVGRLSGKSNLRCSSFVSDVRLTVTYQVMRTSSGPPTILK